MDTKESTADFTELPVITVHKKNIDKYKQKIVEDIQVNLESPTFEAEPDTGHISEVQLCSRGLRALRAGRPEEAERQPGG